MDLTDMVQNWNDWGNQDPMWAILTDPSKKNRQWNENEFFETGNRQISRDLQWLRENDIHIEPGQALDFGCGIGRLTNALATHFSAVHGVDVSASMIDLANQLNRHPGKAVFFHNPKGDLSRFSGGTYDFIYSEIVLQHIPTRYQSVYISEFLRLLSERGIAFFQTVRAVGWRRVIPNCAAEWVRRLKHRGRPFIPMYGISPDRIAQLCQEADCDLFYHASFPVAAHTTRFRHDLYGISRKGNPQQFKGWPYREIKAAGDPRCTPVAP